MNSNTNKALLAALLLCAGAAGAASPGNLTAPDSLKTLRVPEPAALISYVKDRQAAIALGKAFFWDMQVGSDGVQACASCHFHAGADSRSKNEVNPGGDGAFQVVPAPNSTVTAGNFPFHRLADRDDRLSAVLSDTNDVMGSQGVFLGDFLGFLRGVAEEQGKPAPDPLFHVGANDTRRVTGRNAPSVINAAFNYNNFWDGRANFVFNGNNPFGDADVNARAFANDGTDALQAVAVHLENSSLASQAVGPPGNGTEMRKGSFNFAESAQPGQLARAPMIETAFRAPAAGDYDAVVSDSDGQGGPTYFYALHVWGNK